MKFFTTILNMTLTTRHLSNEDAGNYSVNVRNKYGEKVKKLDLFDTDLDLVTNCFDSFMILIQGCK